MLFISHRGNITGANPERENRPDYILEALNKGFDVEVDVWAFGNSGNNGDQSKLLYLGHDSPDHRISLEFLQLHHDRLWCHAKNMLALDHLLQNNLHCFVHNVDDATLTSRNYVWTYPDKQLISNSIMVIEGDPQKKLGLYIPNGVVGICSDHIFDIREKIPT
jgi:hypothetical protein